MFDTSQWPDSECREIAISHSHRNYNRPKTTYGGSVTQVLLSTYKRTDIGGGDAFSFLTQKMLKIFFKKCVTNGSQYVTQMADDSVSFPINNSYPLKLLHFLKILILHYLIQGLIFFNKFTKIYNFFIDVLTVIRNKKTQKLTQKQKKTSFPHHLPFVTY